MNLETPRGIIELGSINIKCIIFKISENNVSEILSTSIVPSSGIHNGMVVNLSKASNAFRSCISLAEKKAKIVLKKINVILEEPEFLSTKFSKNKKINGSKIHKDDIEFLLIEAKKQFLLNDKVLKTRLKFYNVNFNIPLYVPHPKWRSIALSLLFLKIIEKASSESSPFKSGTETLATSRSLL